MKKRVAIVGAGVSGLLACKYALQKGFQPIVFESDDRVGGVWAHTIDSTKLQNIRQAYQFSDFPWPSSAKELYPKHDVVLNYIESYADHFDIYSCIKFNSKVISIDYVGESYEEIESWHLWGGTGKPFGSKGRWHINVQDTKSSTIQVYEAEFVILCIGQFSGLPNIPELPPEKGSQVFNGKVIHSMNYAAMDRSSSEELVKNKRVTIIGTNYPCSMIQRTAHWFLPTGSISGFGLGLLYFNRFAGSLEHKPGETFLLGVLATLLSPLRWGISKFVECYLKWKLPLKKYGMIPRHSFSQDVSSCQIAMLPENFFIKMEEGSIIIKNSPSFSFCKEGVIIEGETKPIKTDVVIYATGFKGDEKLKNIFSSPVFQHYIMGSPASILTLYRQVIHPRIPQLTVIGYAETLSNLYTSEIRCQWLTHLLEGKIELPSIREMEKDVKMWENYIKQNSGNHWKVCEVKQSKAKIIGVEKRSEENPGELKRSEERVETCT
ncbi:hypothetical protein PTKIN_Ptkin19aG0034800 [Pterospermum kingtungense]